MRRFVLHLFHALTLGVGLMILLGVMVAVLGTFSPSILPVLQGREVFFNSGFILGVFLYFHYQRPTFFPAVGVAALLSWGFFGDPFAAGLIASGLVAGHFVGRWGKQAFGGPGEDD